MLDLIFLINTDSTESAKLFLFCLYKSLKLKHYLFTDNQSSKHIAQWLPVEIPEISFLIINYLNLFFSITNRQHKAHISYRIDPNSILNLIIEFLLCIGIEHVKDLKVVFMSFLMPFF